MGNRCYEIMNGRLRLSQSWREMSTVVHFFSNILTLWPIQTIQLVGLDYIFPPEIKCLVWLGVGMVFRGKVGWGGQSNFVTVGCLLIYYLEKQFPLPNKEDGMLVQGISGSWIKIAQAGYDVNLDLVPSNFNTKRHRYRLELIELELVGRVGLAYKILTWGNTLKLYQSFKGMLDILLLE